MVCGSPRVFFLGLMSSEANMGGDKIMHNVIEKQRRNDMKAGLSVLRSLLPQYYTTGRRSVSDQVQEAIGYINHLQKEIDELAKKREVMKMSSISHHQEEIWKTLQSNGGSDPFPAVKIISLGSGIEVSTKTLKEEVLLSDIIHALENDGLEIVSAVASTTDDKVFHTIYAKVSGMKSFHNINLHQKLCHLIRQSMIDA